MIFYTDDELCEYDFPILWIGYVGWILKKKKKKKHKNRMKCLMDDRDLHYKISIILKANFLIFFLLHKTGC